MSSSFYNLNNGGTPPTPSDSVSANPDQQSGSSFFQVDNPTPEATVTAEELVLQATAAASGVLTNATAAHNSQVAAAASASAASASEGAAATSATNAASSASAASASASAAASSASSASSSASTATTQASNASSSASAASGSASAASTSASAASASASAAAISETNAAASAASAAATLASALVKTNNLSDLTNAGTARTNLGLAAVAASGSASDLASGTLPAGRLPAHTGDVTSSAGSAALTIATDAVVTAKIANANVTAAKLASGAAVSNIGYTPSRDGAWDTAKDLTGLNYWEFTVPVWARRITLMFIGLKATGADNVAVQVTNAGGFITTGYVATAQYLKGGVASGYVTNTYCFPILLSANTNQIHGKFEMICWDASRQHWLTHHNTVFVNDTTIHGSGAGFLYLASGGALTKIRIALDASGTFVAGSYAQALYE